MTDREKLELAAKALGNDAQYVCTMFNATDNKCESYGFLVAGKHWNPLTDQADSDRMAGKLRISTLFNDGYLYCFNGGHGSGMITHNNTDEDVCRAVREARLLVAAEIGMVMK